MQRPPLPLLAPLASLVLLAELGLPTLAAPAPTEDEKLLAPDGLAGDSFGAALAADGARFVVGSPEADDSGAASGSAYLLESGSGQPALELVPLGGAAGDRFGQAADLEGSLVAVGAPYADSAFVNAGAVYLFDATTGAQVLKLSAGDAGPDDLFGTAVALDGDVVVVGAPGADGVASDSGAAYVFDVATGSQLAKLAPGDASFLGGGFGEAVDVDAGRVLVGARTADGAALFSGAAYLFDLSTGAQLFKLTSTGAQAWSSLGCSVGLDGDTIVLGARDASPKGKHSGAAFLFDASTGLQTAALVPADGTIFDRFGTSVSVDGPLVAVGAPDDAGGGSAYLFAAQDGTELLKLGASDATSGDVFGEAVAVSQGLVLVGAPGDDDLGAGSGSGYLFSGGAAVSPMTGCLSNAGVLVLASGLPLAGHDLTFVLASGQAGASIALLGFSVAPVPGWPACGLDLGPAGELLIDLAPGNSLGLAALPYAGSPVSLVTAVPDLVGLAGLQVYAQGGFLAPGFATEPLRLTSAIQLTLGGYL